MSNAELAARVLVQGYLRRRKMPRLLRDAVVSTVQARLTSGTRPYLTDWMRADIDNRAEPTVAHDHPSP
ncbi:MAG TPA: hypothetical protein VMS38_33865 [Pseudorhodoferax sp.]|nr:hypothetical protein [Pseudorhodoferax sp.]